MKLANIVSGCAQIVYNTSANIHYLHFNISVLIFQK